MHANIRKLHLRQLQHLKNDLGAISIINKYISVDKNFVTLQKTKNKREYDR